MNVTIEMVHVQGNLNAVRFRYDIMENHVIPVIEVKLDKRVQRQQQQPQTPQQ